MKVLLIAYSDQGGAAKSCIRLHLGLLKIGVASRLLLFDRHHSEIPESYQFYPKYVRRAPSALTNRLRGKIYRLSKELGYSIFNPDEPVSHEDRLVGRVEGFEKFSAPKTDWDITQDENYQWADVVNLHWVAGFLDYGSFFKLNTKPIVWTLHDMNPFTGGCHYSLGCEGYQTSCDKCPQLLGTADDQYSGKLLQVKQDALINSAIKPVIVTPSKWLQKYSQKSRLFAELQHHHIPYGIDTDIFQLRNKDHCKDILGIPQDKVVLLFVAESLNNRRKGFQFLLDTIVKTDDLNLLFCSVGRGDLSIDSPNYLGLGVIKDELLMSIIYSAADLFLITSIEDNLPNTVIESLACGCPVIGSPYGGVREMIDINRNGLLLRELSQASIQSSISDALGNSFDRKEIMSSAAKEYAEVRQAMDYCNLYEQCLEVLDND